MTIVTREEPGAVPDEVSPLSREAAEELAGRICAHAARQARDSCELLILIGEFDAGQGWGWSQGFKSVAHWLAWTCSMTQATAREHIRVARALRRMPTVTAAFGAGELSYSKVREVTRVVDVVDEAQLCQLARYATASQLARMISSYRAAAGTRVRAESRRLFRLVARDGDPLTGITGRLPAEEVAIVTAALERARDLNSTPPGTIDRDSAQADPDEHDATPPYTDADAFLDVCRHYLATAVTEDESGEDRTLVIIEVAAEQLALADVPAGVTTREHPVAPGQLVTVELNDVPAGTQHPYFTTRTADTSEPSAGTGVWPTIISPAVRDGDVPAGTPQPAGIAPWIADADSVSAGLGSRSAISSPVARSGDVPAGTPQPAGIAPRIADADSVSAGLGSRSAISSPVARSGDVRAGTLQPASQDSRITDAAVVPTGTGGRPVITAPIADMGSADRGEGPMITSSVGRDGGVPAGTRQPAGIISQIADAGESSVGAGRWPTTVSPAAPDGGGPAGTGGRSMIISPAAGNGDVPAGTQRPSSLTSRCAAEDAVPPVTPQPATTTSPIADPVDVPAATAGRLTITSPVSRKGDVPAGTPHPAGIPAPIADPVDVRAATDGWSTTTSSPVSRDGGVPAGTSQAAGIPSPIADSVDAPAARDGWSTTTSSPVSRDGGVPAGTSQAAGIPFPIADPVDVRAARDGWSTITTSSPRWRNGDVPAGTSQAAGVPSPIADPVDVPAGTRPGTADRADRSEFQRPTTSRPVNRESSLRAQVCTVRGAGPVEPQTAQRMICTGSILGAIVDRHGDVLALGRTRRLVSKRQRRALLIRDQLCQFPGCWRDRRLQAHHRVPWSHGGTTDLANLILLCGFHHTVVHEGGITITRRNGAPYLGARTGDPGWRFLLPGGQPVAETGWRVRTADQLVRDLSTAHPSGPNDHDHPDATTIRTIGGGEGFSLHNCVEALFSMTVDQDHAAA
ncbi:DUF222 domain-containing protein [Microlunatus sp. GCM10028923]